MKMKINYPKIISRTPMRPHIGPAWRRENKKENWPAEKKKRTLPGAGKQTK